MAANAAIASGTSYSRKRSSLRYIFSRAGHSKKGDSVARKEALAAKLKPVGGVYHSGGNVDYQNVDPILAKAILPNFYNATEPPRIVVMQDGDDEASNLYNNHQKLSLQASTSSVNSTHRPLMVVVDNNVILAPQQQNDQMKEEPGKKKKTKAKKKKNSETPYGGRQRQRRSSSWKEPGPMTKAIPYMSSTSGAYACCFVNVILPGFGTFIAAIIAGLRPDLARSEFSPSRTFCWNFCAFIIQLAFSPLLFGWIYGILWGLEAIERSKLLALSKLAEKHQHLQAEMQDAADEDEFHRHQLQPPMTATFAHQSPSPRTRRHHPPPIETTPEPVHPININMQQDQVADEVFVVDNEPLTMTTTEESELLEISKHRHVEPLVHAIIDETAPTSDRQNLPEPPNDDVDDGDLDDVYRRYLRPNLEDVEEQEPPQNDV